MRNFLANLFSIWVPAMIGHPERARDVRSSADDVAKILESDVSFSMASMVIFGFRPLTSKKGAVHFYRGWLNRQIRRVELSLGS